MKRRKFLIPLIVLVIAAAVGIAVFLRKAAPPEPVRLLPEAQAYLYINANPLRRADIKVPPVQIDPEYDAFIKQTGFQFERDLDEAAIAVHAPPPNTPNGENRFSEVFVARFEFDKVRSYLHSLANRVDSYRDLEIFNIPRARPGGMSVPVSSDPISSLFLMSTIRSSSAASSTAIRDWRFPSADRCLSARITASFRLAR